MKKLFTALSIATAFWANAQTVTDYVTVSGNPTGIAFDQQGTLYIGGESDYSVRKYYQNGTLTVLKSDMNGQPRQMSFDKNGQLWIAFWALSSFKSMNPLNGSTTSYPANLPFGIAQNPVNNLIYFSESGAQSGIYTYNNTTAEMLTLPYTIARPRGLAFDAAGNLYAASYTDGAIYKFDTAGNKTTVVNNVKYPCYIALDANNNIYISTESSGTIYKYNLAKTDMQAELFVQGLGYSNGLAVYNGDLYCAIVSKNKVVKISLPNLATSEANLSQFAIENPVGNTLSYQTKEAVKQIELYSAEGRLVKTITANNADVSALAKGMYVAKITFKNGQTASKKIIKK